MLDHRCTIELRDSAFEQRAKILSNHLYFSDLPVPFKEAMLEDDFSRTPDNASPMTSRERNYSF